MLSIWACCAGDRSSCFATVFKYSVLALLSQNGRGWSALWATRFMASAPATAPLMNTSSNTLNPASLGDSHNGAAVGLATELWLIVRQRHQHLVGVWSSGCIRHQSLWRGRFGRIRLLARYQNRAQHGQRQQRCKHHPAAEFEIAKRTPERDRRTFLEVLHNLR